MTPWRRSENSAKSFVSSRCGVEPKTQKCKVCGYNHPIWHCDVFKGRLVESRWETAKQLGLCYRCLSKDHIGKACPRYRECKINGCTETHHRLLHAEKAIAQSETQRGRFEGRNTLPAQVADSGTTTANQESSDGTRTRSANQTRLSQDSVTSQITEGDASTHKATMEIAQTREKVVALQTVPLILRNGNIRLLVNCFLDEGSDTTYINEDVVEELGVKGQKNAITVNVANDG